LYFDHLISEFSIRFSDGFQSDEEKQDHRYAHIVDTGSEVAFQGPLQYHQQTDLVFRATEKERSMVLGRQQGTVRAD